MRIAVALLLVLWGGAVLAQQQSDPLGTIDRLLTVIRVDAQAIDSYDLPVDDIQRLSNEIWNSVAQLPYWAAGEPSVEPILVEMRERSAALLQYAAAQDNVGAGIAARNVLDAANRLGRGLGLTP